MCVLVNSEVTPMKDVSMMPVIVMPRIGVNPDGSPVVYDPEKAAAKRAEIVAQIREKNGIPDDRFLTVSFTPELENGYVRSPERDTVEISTAKEITKLQNQAIQAKITPQEVIAWGTAFDAVAGLVAKYGPEVIEFFKDMLANSKPVPTVEPPKDHSDQHTTVPEKHDVPDFAMVD